MTDVGEMSSDHSDSDDELNDQSEEDRNTEIRRNVTSRKNVRIKNLKSGVYNRSPIVKVGKSKESRNYHLRRVASTLKQLYVIHNVETLLLKAVPNPSVSIIDGEYNGQFAKEAVNSTYGKKLAKQWLSGWSLYQRNLARRASQGDLGTRENQSIMSEIISGVETFTQEIALTAKAAQTTKAAQTNKAAQTTKEAQSSQQPSTSASQASTSYVSPHLSLLTPSPEPNPEPLFPQPMKSPSIPPSPFSEIFPSTPSLEPFTQLMASPSIPSSETSLLTPAPESTTPLTGPPRRNNTSPFSEKSLSAAAQETPLSPPARLPMIPTSLLSETSPLNPARVVPTSKQKTVKVVRISAESLKNPELLKRLMEMRNRNLEANPSLRLNPKLPFLSNK